MGFQHRRPNPVFSDEYRVLLDVVRQARRRSGLSQRELSTRLGKAQSHVCMIERGQRRIDSLELYFMAKAVGVDPGVLFGQIARRLDAVGQAAG
jgi:transcriptional regulator with XRE-family HTH domain